MHGPYSEEAGCPFDRSAALRAGGGCVDSGRKIIRIGSRPATAPMFTCRQAPTFRKFPRLFAVAVCVAAWLATAGAVVAEPLLLVTSSRAGNPDLFLIDI